MTNKRGLWVLFALSVALRFLLANFYPKTINCYPDELYYYHAAESLWNHGTILLANQPSDFTHVGYSLLIAPAFAFSNLQARGTVIALINAVLLSSGIFPISLFAKELLSNRRHQLLACLLYVLSPTMTYAMTYMAENLFVPMALWMLYVLWKFAQAKGMRTRIAWGISFVALLALGYLTKPQALYFVVAFLMYIVCFMLFSGKKGQRIVAILLVVAGVAGLLLLIHFGVAELAFLQPDLIQARIGYVLYYFCFYLGMMLLAFFVFPVLLPILERRYAKEGARQLFDLLLCYLFVNAVVVALMVSAIEDYPSLAPRAHLRYVEWAFVPLVMILLHILENRETSALPAIEAQTWQGNDRHIYSFLMRHRWAVGMSVCAVFMALFCFGMKGATIDYTMLFYFTPLAMESSLLHGIGIAEVIAEIVVAVLFVRMFLKDSNQFQKRILLLLFLLCIANHVLSTAVQYITHSHSEAEVAEIHELRAFVQTNADVDFYIAESGGADEMIDTYLVDCDNVYTTLAPIYMQSKEAFFVPQKFSYYVYEVGAEVPDTYRVVREYEHLGSSGYVLYESTVRD